jgi:hypothetical protein
MTHKTRSGLIVVAVVLALGAGAWLLLHKTMLQKARYIVKKGYAGNEYVLVTFDKGYIEAWYVAAQNGTSAFSYNGKTYSTQGGTQIS